MEYPTGQVLSAPVVNGSPTDLFGTHIDYLGVGGYRSVPTISDRNSIPTKSALEYDGLGSGMRRHFMLVAVQETGLIYILYKSDFQTLPNDSARLAALKDNANWILFSNFLNIKNSSSSSNFIQDEFAEYTAASDGVQVIPLPTGANAVLDVTVLEVLGGVRKVYQKSYSVVNSILTISADAKIITGDKICGTYYIKGATPVNPGSETLVILDAQGDDYVIIVDAQAS